VALSPLALIAFLIGLFGILDRAGSHLSLIHHMEASGFVTTAVVWHRTESGIHGELDMPMAVGTVGGSTRVHRGVRAAFELMGVKNAGELAIVMGAAGMASNLAALRALAGEGIQRGHMRLHSRKEEVLENARLHAQKVERGGT